MQLADLINSEKNSIFLTGVTGAVGARIFLDLHRNYSDYNLIVPIRKKFNRTPEERFFETLRFFDLEEEEINEIAGKTLLLNCDLYQKDFGIDADTYHKLAAKTSIIFHSAADVRTHESYEVLKKANIDITLNVFTFYEKMKKVHSHNSFCCFNYVSTAFTCGKKLGTVPEEKYADKKGLSFRNNYELTKFEAKQMLLALFKDKDWNFRIFEPSFVCGCSKKGLLQDYKIYFRLIQLYYLKALLLFPVSIFKNKTATIDTIPVDWLSTIIIETGLDPKASNEVYRLVYGKESMKTKDFVNSCIEYLNRDKGANIKVVFVPVTVFKIYILFKSLFTKGILILSFLEKTKMYSSARKFNAVYPFLKSAIPYMTDGFLFENDQTMKRLKELGHVPDLPGYFDSSETHENGFVRLSLERFYEGTLRKTPKKQ